MSAVDTATSTARRAAYSPTVEAIARVGYAVRGILYVMIGLLALRLVIGRSGQAPSPQGAIATIAQQPAGHVLLWIVFIGFLAYAFWCLVRFLFNPLHKPGFGARIAALVSMVAYGFLAWTTYGFLNGNGSSGSSSQSHFLGQIMTMPAGRYIVGLVGVILFIVGVVNMSRGIRDTFERQFSSYALTRDEARIARTMGRFGTFARGVVYAIIGILIFYAAYTSNPSQPVGIDTVFSTLMKQPYGALLVIIVGLGLIAFGIYSLMAAAWFRLRRS